MTSPDDRPLQEYLFPPTDERLRRRLFAQALLGLLALLIALWLTAKNDRSGVFPMGMLITVLSLLPLLVWARQIAHNYPFFEIFLATNVTSYGIPLLTESDAVRVFDESTRQAAALAVILFLATACAAYFATRARPGRAAFWTKPVLERLDRQWMLRGLVLTTAYTLVVPYFYGPPAGIDSILRAVFFGIGMTCTFILAMAWGLGRLNARDKAVIAVCLVLQFFLLSSGLILRAGVSTLLLGFVGYFFGSRRIPYVTLAATVAALAVLNIGKYDMRAAYWMENYHREPTLTELPAFYGEWFQAGLTPKAQAEDKPGALLLERNSLLQILCLVVNRSPDYLPFLHGETYAQIPGQFVPRLLWPEKPRGHISTYTLSIYYGLQDVDATYTTTIAFGFLPEAYANFGYWGVAALGALFGFGFRKITLWSAQSPIFSWGGLLLILLSAWSFQTELTLSAWLSSLFQAAASILALVFVFRRVQDAAG